MNGEKLVSIRVTKSQKRRLDQLKVHPRQAYHEIVEKLLEKKRGK